ncbi:MAG: PAS domain-containing protein [Desulfovibrio sp.]|uniref:PAS domain-containing protein n=1 Tax=Desulfovibrio sp. 7SRBS1 TaxID=3378064 RepID=UPI003B3D639A
MSQDSRLGSDPLLWLKERPESVEDVPSSHPEPDRAAVRETDDAMLLTRTVDRMLHASMPENQDTLWQPDDILEHLPLALCVCDGEGALVYANPAFFRLSGYSVRDIASLSVQDDSLFYGQSQTCTDDVKARLADSGLPQHCLIELLCADGSLVLVEADFYPGGESWQEESFYLFLRQACGTDEADLADPPCESEPEREQGVSPELRAALDAALCLCGDTEDTDSRDEAMRGRFAAAIGEEQELFSKEKLDSASLVRAFEITVGSVCRERGVDRELLDFGCSVRIGAVQRREALLFSYVLYMVLHSSFQKKRSLEPCRLQARVEEGGSALGLVLLGETRIFFRKMKLHDKKRGPLQRIAQRIVQENGSIFFIRREDTTEVKIKLPTRGSSGGANEQKETQD